LFKKLEILPFYSQYTFSLSMFVVKKRKLYTANQGIHGINTRYNKNLHLPMANLTAFQRGANFFFKLFNHQAITIKNVSN